MTLIAMLIKSKIQATSAKLMSSVKLKDTGTKDKVVKQNVKIQNVM